MFFARNHLKLESITLLLSMRFSLMQIDVSDTENPSSRIDYVLQILKDTQPDCFVTLPELWISGAFSKKSYSLDSIRENELGISKIQTCPSLPIGSFGTYLVKTTSGETYNRMYNFDSNKQLTTYDKVHTFGFDSIESQVVVSGNEISMMSIQSRNFGLAICYDLRFPELFRKMVRQGMEVLIITASWPLSRISHWRNLLIARAIENQVLVIAVNAVGTQGQTKLGGHSMVVSPTGEILHELGEEPVTLNFEINLEQVTNTRESFPVLKDIKILSI